MTKDTPRLDVEPQAHRYEDLLHTIHNSVSICRTASGKMDQQLFVSRYLVALPKAEDLERLLDGDRALIEQMRCEDKEEVDE